VTQWTNVVTNPLGLAGFALFLVFLLLKRRIHGRPWLSRIFVALAALALVGGLWLSYAKGRNSTPPTVQTTQMPAPVQGQANQTQQISTGPGSPNVQGTQGDVSINVDQSTGKTGVKKTPEKKPKPESK